MLAVYDADFNAALRAAAGATCTNARPVDTPPGPRRPRERLFGRGVIVAPLL